MGTQNLPDAKIKVVLDIDSAKRQLEAAKAGKPGGESKATLHAPTTERARVAGTVAKRGTEEVLSNYAKDYTALAWRVRGGFETVQSMGGAAQGGLDYLVGAGENAIAGRVMGALGTYGTGAAIGVAGVAAGAGAVYATYKAGQAGASALSAVGAAYAGYAASVGGTGAAGFGEGVEARMMKIEDWINEQGMKMTRFFEGKAQGMGFDNAEIFNESVRHGGKFSEREREQMNMIERIRKDNDARLERSVERNMDHRLNRKIGNDFGTWFKSFFGM